MATASESNQIRELFTRTGHHRHISCLYLVQNAFNKGKFHREVSINTNHFILTKNVRDQTITISLARQMFPSKPGYLIEAYNDVTTGKFGHLLIDLKPQTDDRYRQAEKSTQTPAALY